MGNITTLRRENEHLKNQNTGLMQAMKRVRSAMTAQAAESAEAIRELSSITAAYIGALCLSAGESVEIRHDLIKKVLEEYNVLVENGEQEIRFSIVEKAE